MIHKERTYQIAKHAINQLQAELDTFDSAWPQIQSWLDYYGSSAWFDDVDTTPIQSYLDQGQTMSVLSEDEPDETVALYRNLAIRMLECGTRMLKEI